MKTKDLMDIFYEVINQVDLLNLLDNTEIDEGLKYADGNCQTCKGKGVYFEHDWWICSCVNKEVCKDIILKLMEDYKFYFKDDPDWTLLLEGK